jgi:hypothetical protein
VGALGETVDASGFATGSGRFDDGEQARNDSIAGDAFGIGFERRQHAMAQDIGGDALHVVGRHERPTAQEGMRASRLRESNRGAWRRPELDERTQISRADVAAWMLAALAEPVWPGPAWGSRTPQLANG